jgi:NADPH2:quinone reductase
MNHTRVVVSRHGGPDVLVPIEEPVPEPGPGEARVRVLAAGVSGYDLMFRRSGALPGTPKPPFALGEDVVGVVDKLGPATNGGEAANGTTGADDPPPVGTVVAATTFSLGLGGGYAEHVCLPVGDLVPVPDGVDPAEAVCVVVNYLTAHMVMHQAAAVEPGQTVLIHGGGGGVGSALLDLGRHAGLTMFSTASPRNHELVRSFGAEPIDYHTEDFVEVVLRQTRCGADVVFDPVGGARQLARSFRATRRGGKLVWFGMAAAKTRGLKAIAGTLLMRALLGVVPSGKRVVATGDLSVEPLPGLLSLLRDKKLSPAVAARVSLHEASQAHEILESGRYGGKVVLVTDA